MFLAKFNSPPEEPGGRRRGQRGLRPSGARVLCGSPRALPQFICTSQAPYSRLRSKLSREEAMAKSRGRLYLWMCLAAALASFLVGFLVGECTNPLPAAQGGRSSAEKPGWAVLGSLGR